jgi:type I restriction enzyme, S subunit
MVNWPTKKLGDVTKIEGGGTPSTKNPLFWNGDVSWLTPKELSNFSDREIFDTERKITSEGLRHSKLFPAGTVLFTSRAPIGYVAIAGIQMATNQGFKNFICNEKILNNSFLYYFLKLKTKYLQSLGRGATFTEISRSILAKVDIPLPLLDTQKQIVERLDKIVEAQKLNDDLIQKTDELFQSLLHKELNPAGKNWEIKKIKDVAEVKNGGTPSTKNQKYWNGKILWLTPKELSGFEDIKISDTERKISDEGLKHSSATLLPTGTVLLTSRAPIGYIAIAGVSMATNQGFKNFICDSKSLNNEFLYFFLRLKTKYLQSLGRGATFTEISKTTVEKIDIPLPSLQTQKQIVAKLSAVQDYKTKLLAQKSKLKELFDSVLHKSMNNT